MRNKSLIAACLLALMASFWAPAHADPQDPDPIRHCKLHNNLNATIYSCLKLPENLVQLPNLSPLPPEYVVVAYPIRPDLFGLMTSTDRSRRVLRFTTTIANRGAYALDLLGAPLSDPERWTALQCISWDGRVCKERREAGEFVWHPDHNHWHFEGFALYELRLVDTQGRPDMSAAGLVSTSGKVSFCLLDSESHGSSEQPFYVACAGVIQGISPGWADVYDAFLPGQELSMTEVADRRYALVYIADPEDRLAETDETDNVAYSLVEIYENGTKARIVS